VRRAPALLLILACALAAWALYSYWTAGFVYVLASGTPGQGPWLDRVREAVAGWGRLAPLVYTLAVVVEVIVAPIPGTLLYAPAGAIFGGFVGGSLSLAGNVIGAAICCVIGQMIGGRVLARRVDGSKLDRYRTLLEQRGMWLVLLLRLNPLTTSDLVSYAAGVAGVPAWKVALGTLFGLAPWCYLQAYFAEQVFEVVPGPYLIVGGVALIIIAVGVLVFGSRRGGDIQSGQSPGTPNRDSPRGHPTGTVPGDTQP
jgi:uncharacterized membrane protein YdjX (TVP38/TMEM64 family)